MAVFLLVRWIVVLPGMLPVLVGLEYVARRAPHARVLTAIVAFAPMLWWELSQSPDGFSEGAVLGVTAVLFALVARLPARLQGESTDDRGAAQPPVGPVLAAR
jgi:multisubunit Na+/H+ antiporter MnhB subunit